MNFSPKYFLVSLIGRHPLLFRCYYTLHPDNRRLVVTRQSDIVIEGFPRSANTFSVIAFEQAQQRPVRIAHHLHAPQQVALGVAYGIPVLVLIREPVSAIASLLTRHPSVSVRQAINQYISFYAVVLERLQSVVLADFKSVTSDYSRVIQALNTRFGTDYATYVNAPANDDEVFGRIDSINAAREGDSVDQVARPNRGRSEKLNQARSRVAADSMIQQAVDLYEKLRPSCV